MSRRSEQVYGEAAAPHKKGLRVDRLGSTGASGPSWSASVFISEPSGIRMLPREALVLARRNAKGTMLTVEPAIQKPPVLKIIEFPEGQTSLFLTVRAIS